MMFKGAYTSEFYRELHDALHKEVESWSPPSPWKFSVTEALPASDPSHPVKLDDLWSRVEQLEQSCRNPDATRLPALVCSAVESES